MPEATTHHSALTGDRTDCRVELKFASDPSTLRPVRLELEQFAQEMGVGNELVDRMGLVLNEALANVMRHGYGGARDKPIVVTFECRGEAAGKELEIRIRDWARPFDPAKLPADPPKPDPDTIKPGGLGLLCMRKMMDKVVFTPLQDGMLLTMVKRIGK
jgi:anti-sigma regulatory factor (Ser/Thr protein kinase)